MANSDKNINIRPETNTGNLPSITYTGFDNDPITVSVLDDNTLSWEGSAGQLFSISPSLTGTIFSVNDISGIPSIEVDDNGIVKIAPFSGNVLLGSTTDNGSGKLQVTGEITATNEVTAYFSDERLKDFEKNIDNALEIVNSLNGYYYTENDKAKELGYTNDKRQIGVSAQEVEKVLPELVAPAPIDNSYLTVKYEKIVPVLIEAIKELSTQISELKNQNTNNNVDKQ